MGSGVPCCFVAVFAFLSRKFGGAAQQMIKRNSKVLSALMIVTQWVCFAPPSRRGRHCGKGVPASLLESGGRCLALGFPRLSEAGQVEPDK